jgi:hypothetical protein
LPRDSESVLEPTAPSFATPLDVRASQSLSVSPWVDVDTKIEVESVKAFECALFLVAVPQACLDGLRSSHCLITPSIM